MNLATLAVCRTEAIRLARHIRTLDAELGGVHIWARAKVDAVRCPSCGAASRRVRSRYERGLADAAFAGRRVEIRLRVRRFFCYEIWCATRRFAEQVPGLTSRYARRSPLLARMLEEIGLALAGRAAARLARRLGVVVSRNTMVRLVRGLPDPATDAVRVLGVDDFALRR